MAFNKKMALIITISIFIFAQSGEAYRSSMVSEPPQAGGPGLSPGLAPSEASSEIPFSYASFFPKEATPESELESESKAENNVDQMKTQAPGAATDASKSPAPSVSKDDEMISAKKVEKFISKIIGGWN